MQLRILLAENSKSNTLPLRETNKSKTIRNQDFPTALHRSISRYLNTQADKSLFRDNALIDTQISNSQERMQRYLSPYRKAAVGDITVNTKLPKLHLETQKQSKEERHQDQIMMVNKNVLSVETKKEAIDYFAQRYDKRQRCILDQKSLKLSPRQLLSHVSSKESFDTKLSSASVSLHNRLKQNDGRQPSQRAQFLNFLKNTDEWHSKETEKLQQHREKTKKLFSVKDISVSPPRKVKLGKLQDKRNIRMLTEWVTNHRSSRDNTAEGREAGLPISREYSISSPANGQGSKKSTKVGSLRSAYLQSMQIETYNGPKAQKTKQGNNAFSPKSSMQVLRHQSSSLFPLVSRNPEDGVNENDYKDQNFQNPQEVIDAALTKMRQVQMPKKVRKTLGNAGPVLNRAKTNKSSSTVDDTLPQTQSMTILPTMRKLSKKGSKNRINLVKDIRHAYSKNFLSKTKSVTRANESSSGQGTTVADSQSVVETCSPSIKSIKTASVARLNNSGSYSTLQQHYQKDPLQQSKTTVFVRYSKKENAGKQSSPEKQDTSELLKHKMKYRSMLSEIDFNAMAEKAAADHAQNY